MEILGRVIGWFQSERRRSIDDLTGKPQRSSVKSTHAYINDAFSFLKTDEYNPYNFYEDSKLVPSNFCLKT